MKYLNKFDKRRLFAGFIVFIAMIFIVFIGCGGGGGGSDPETAPKDTVVYVPVATPITYKEKVVKDKITKIDVGSVRLELPANAFTPNTEVIIVEDTELTGLGSFFAGYTPQSSLFTLKISTPLSSLTSLRQTALIDRSGTYLDGIATLAIRLNSQFDVNADYSIACRDKLGNWYFTPYEGRSSTGFYINVSNLFQDYLLVKRNSATLTTFVGKGLSLSASPTATLLASYTTKKFETDLDIAVKFAVNPNAPGAFAENKLLLQVIAYNEFTATFLYNDAEGNETTGTANVRSADNGTVCVSDRKILSVFSKKSTFVSGGYVNTVYTARLKLKGLPAADFPRQIVFKAFYPGETNAAEYSAETNVLLGVAPKPPTNPVIVSSVPASGAVLLPPDNIRIEFSHKMVESSLTNAFALKDGATNITFTQSLDEGQKLVRITPDTLFVADKTYTVTVATSARAIAAEGGLTVASPILFNFKTVSSSGVTTIPANNAIGIASATDIVFIYDKLITNTAEVVTAFYRTSEIGNPNAILTTPVPASLTAPVWTVVSSGSQLRIAPENDLAYNTKYELVVSNGKYTESGTEFAVADHSLTFTADAQPELIARTPSGANALPESPITLTFNKVMATSTVRVFLTDKTTNNVIELTSDNAVISWDETQTVLRVQPNMKLAANTEYGVTLAPGAVDIYNNPIKPIDEVTPWTFATTPQTAIVSHSPVANAVDVATSTPVVITFAEGLTADQVQALTTQSAFRVRNITYNKAVVGSITCEIGSNTATFFPYSYNYYDYDSTFEVTLSGLKDSLGYDVATYSYRFDTYIQPYIVAYSPELENVLVTEDINLTFSRPMNADTVQVFLSNQLQTALNADIAWSGNNTVLSVRPKVKLQYNTPYTVRIGAGAADANKNPLKVVNNTWNFTTTGETSVISVEPKANLVDVATSTKVNIVFAEILTDVQKDLIRNGSIITVKDGGAALTGNYSFFSDRAEFTPTQPFNHNSVIEVAIAGLVDESGYEVPGYDFSFKTISRPTITENFPVSGSTLVTEPIVLTFSRPIATATVKLSLNGTELVHQGNATYTWGPDVASPTILTVRTYEKLTYNTAFQVQVAPAAGFGSIKDTLDNDLDPAVKTFDFTTVGQTLIAAVEPKQNETNVLVNTKVKVSFLEDLNETQKSGVNVNLFYVNGNTPIPPHPLTGKTWPDNKTLVFNPQYALDYDRPEIRVEVTGLRDKNGYLVDSYHTSLATATAGDAGVSTFSYVFTLAPRPVIFAHTPKSNQLNVPVTDPIVITFSEAMNLTTTEAAVSIIELRPDDGTTPERAIKTSEYNTSWNSDDPTQRKILTIKPNANFSLANTIPALSNPSTDPGTDLTDPTNVNFNGEPRFLHNATYTVYLRNSATAYSGIPIRATYFWTFSTHPGSAPSIKHFNIDRDHQKLTVTFNVIATGTDVDLIGLEYYSSKQAVASCTTDAADPRSKGDTISVDDNGLVTVVLNDLYVNDVYTLTPYVKTAYGAKTLHTHAPRKAVVHPFNLENNNDGIEKTVAELDISNRFVIANAKDLLSLSHAVAPTYWAIVYDNNDLPLYRSENFIQIANIDLTSTPWAPVGNAATAFTGTYNGQNYTISNLSVSAGPGGTGMFGVLSGATLSNIRLVDVAISATDQTNVGSLVGIANGASRVEKCRASLASAVTSSAPGAFVGGLIGNITGASVITDSHVDAKTWQIYSAASTVKVGGVIGYLNPAATISDSTFASAFTHADPYSNPVQARNGDAGCVVGSPLAVPSNVVNCNCFCSTNGLSHKHVLVNDEYINTSEIGIHPTNHSYVVSNVNIKPVATVTAPLPFKENVISKPVISLEFCKPMDTATVENAFSVVLYPRNGPELDAVADDPDALTLFKGNFQFNWDTSSRKFTAIINELEGLRSNATYTIKLNDSVAKDVYGNTIHPMTDLIFFTQGNVAVASITLAANTPEGTAPDDEDIFDLPVEYFNKKTIPLNYLTKSAAAAKVTDVAVATRIAAPGLRITYSEPLRPEQREAIYVAGEGMKGDKIKLTSKPSIITDVVPNSYVIDEVRSAWDPYDNQTLYLWYKTDLAYDHNVMLELSEEVFDSNGTKVNATSTWYFETTPQPIVAGVYPTDGSDKVLLKSPISVTFEQTHENGHRYN
ncbi:MAG: Ig-like domain-containing protein [Candidatus Ozemobacteraceae bacterium]